MTTENQSFDIHSQNSENPLWNVDYQGPLLVSFQGYKKAYSIYSSIHASFDEFIESYFGSSSRSAVADFEEIKHDFVNKSILYAAALFAATNSPINVLQIHSMLLSLREVVCEIEKCGSRYLSSSQMEVMVACLMKLATGLHGKDSCKECYQASAIKYARAVLGDVTASRTTRMLVLARAWTIPTTSPKTKAMYKQEVVDMLSEIYADPTKITLLEEGWKTYAQLARMVFSWKHMFFGIQKYFYK